MAAIKGLRHLFCSLQVRFYDILGRIWKAGFLLKALGDLA